MSNPYLLPEPAVLSLSGGRTSGYLLWESLKAFGGKLPPCVKVIFTNTGKERLETLDFVERISLEWGVEIIWLEFRWEPGRYFFEQVNYATASRKGEPFEQLILAKSALPDFSKRFCTVELKIRTMERYVRQVLKWRAFVNAIGLRYDEPDRVAKATGDRVAAPIEDTLFGPEIVEYYNDCPLFKAKVIKSDIMQFWGGQSFDLQLGPNESNCDLCFLKGMGTRIELMRNRPDDARWWIDMEQLVPLKNGSTAKFRAHQPAYSELLAMAETDSIVSDSDHLSCECTD